MASKTTMLDASSTATLIKSDFFPGYHWVLLCEIMDVMILVSHWQLDTRCQYWLYYQIFSALLMS